MPSSKKSAPTQLDLAKSATLLATRSGKIRFGAPVTATQILCAQTVLAKKPFARKNILVAFAISEKQLRDLAENRVSQTQLSAKTRAAMTAFSAACETETLKHKRTYKSWPRKNAAMLYVLHTARKRSTPKPPRATEPPAPATAE